VPPAVSMLTLQRHASRYASTPSLTLANKSSEIDRTCGSDETVQPPWL
jgi:hypothetical protein